jgi:epsilon-lactone hydrolase
MARPKPPPVSISREAQAFIAGAPPLIARALSPATIGERRAEGYRSFAPAGEAIRQSLGVRLEEENVAGIRVQSVIPPKCRADQAVIYFFGGGYVEGSPEEDLSVTARLSVLLGRRILVPRYRLAPEQPFPAALDDGLAVFGDLARRLAGPNLALAGESAGGSLALAVALRASAAKLTMPSAVAVMSPWADLSKTGDTLTSLAGYDPTIDYELTLESMARAYAGEHDLRSPLVSPVYAEYPASFPPTLITSATRDLFLSDCARLSTRMRRAGIEAELRVWEGLWHSFEFYPGIPEGGESLAEVARFLDRHFATAGDRISGSPPTRPPGA